ncbi:MAG: PKD domain-containing protein, partial [Saprospiraceae bacterium]|nr:PKD domain-containing protein [Saprospiraceae bacterium]
MLKTDVGWGQACGNNLIQNPNFFIDPTINDGYDAFCDGHVPDWRGVENTPHILQDSPSGPICDYYIPDPTSTVACLRSGPGATVQVFLESIAQEGLTLSDDPLVTYNISVDSRLICEEFASYTYLDVYLLESSTLPQNCLNPTLGWIPSNFQSIMHATIDWFNLQAVSQDFTVSNTNYNTIYLRSMKDYNPNDPSQTVLGIDEVRLTCTTTALTDLIINNTSGMDYNFDVQNSSNVSTFSSYSWDFGDGGSSSAPNPSHTYAQTGTYNVCLDIIDSNGCCGHLCEELIVQCTPIIPTISITNNCPSYTFVPSGLSEDIDYQWYVNGQLVGVAGVFIYNFPNNGTYVIELLVDNGCGEIVKVTETIVVDCNCDAPTADFTNSIACIDRQGQVSFSVVGYQSDVTYTWNFGDGTNMSSTSPAISHTYTADGTYEVTLVATNACGDTASITKTINISCAAACQGEPNQASYTITAQLDEIRLSEAFTNLGIPFDPTVVNVYSDMHFNITGTLIFDISTSFTKSDFVAYQGAKIILNPSGTSQAPYYKGVSEFYGCNFYGCEQMWQGIETQGHTANFLGGSIRDALYGIHVNNDGNLLTRSVEFSNNFVGMYFTSSPSHLIVGNHFTGGGLLPGYSGMPSYANKNLCGIYSGGAKFNPNFTGFSGNFSLNVGKLDDLENVFENMNNGIICKGAYFVNIKNNTLKNFPLANIIKMDMDISTNDKGTGVMIQGGGIVGGFVFEQNKFINCNNGIRTENIVQGLHIKNNNIFHDLKNGVLAERNELYALQLVVEDENDFICSESGVYCKYNIGHDFRIKDNTFTISEINDEPNPSGIHLIANAPGFWGRGGTGHIQNNEFFMRPTTQHSNGAVQVVNYKKVELTDENEFFIFTPSPVVTTGHEGFSFQNMDQSVVKDNEFFNFSPGLRSGINSILNVQNNAICCNMVSEFNTGFNLVGAQIGKSTFKQNEMFDNLKGLHLALNCSIGDQPDYGNNWTGVSRVAAYNGINTIYNTFFANEAQNNSLRSFWPVQSPHVWFKESPNYANYACEGACVLPLEGVTGSSTPSSENIQVLEEMLEDDHIVTESYREPSIWAKDRWLYGYLTMYPQFLTASERLNDFYTSVPEDVHAYEDFYKAIAAAITPVESEISVVNASQSELQGKLETLEATWNQYLIEPKATLSDAMDAIRNSISESILPTGPVESTFENRRMQELQTLKSQVGSLPHDKPYTAVAQEYASIYLDQLMYGDIYVIDHHLGALQQLAGLCEPLYKETVVLARNMLAGLGYEAYYNDDDLCPVQLENRKRTEINQVSVQLSPNPTTGKVMITTSTEIIHITVGDATGNVLKSINGSDIHEFDISELPTGVYLVTLINAKSEATVSKLIKIE